MLTEPAPITNGLGFSSWPAGSVSESSWSATPPSAVPSALGSAGWPSPDPGQRVLGLNSVTPAPTQAPLASAGLRTLVASANSPSSGSGVVPTRISGNLSASLIEGDRILQASGQLSVNGRIRTEPAFQAVSLSGSYGTLDLGGNGNWTYITSSPLNQLRAGEMVRERFTVQSSDGSATAPLTITIRGSDDAPVIRGIGRANLVESNVILQTSGRLMISDVDNPLASFEAVSVRGRYGTLVLASDGAWSYTSSSPLDQLKSGQVVNDNLVVRSSDGRARAPLTISITGSDDSAVITGTLQRTLDQDGSRLTCGGQLLIQDVDGPVSGFTAQRGTRGLYGSFSLSSSGAWTYTCQDNLASLRQGISLRELFAVKSRDGLVSSQVEIVINGSLIESEGRSSLSQGRDGSYRINNSLTIREGRQVVTRNGADGWSPMAVEARPEGGYWLVWQQSSGSSRVWSLDPTGKQSSSSGELSSQQIADFESILQQDLNRDGVIQAAPRVVEAVGSVRLLEGEGGYYLNSLASPLLSKGRQLDRQSGTCRALAVEGSDSGCSILLGRDGGELDLLNVDISGRVLKLETNLDASRVMELEPLLGQDLNGDGHIRRTWQGTAGGDRLAGSGWDDLYRASAGNDSYAGQAGDDRIDYAAIGEAITLSSGWTVNKTNGKDQLDGTIEMLLADQARINSVDWSSSSEETIQLDLRRGALTVRDLSGLEKSSILLQGFRRGMASGGNDTLIGNGDCQLVAGAGDDRLEARGGDAVDGGAGEDLLVLEGRSSEYRRRDEQTLEELASGRLITVRGVETVRYSDGVSTWGPFHEDLAGNSIATARSLGSLESSLLVEDWLEEMDPVDVYSFDLRQDSMVSILVRDCSTGLSLNLNSSTGIPLATTISATPAEAPAPLSRRLTPGRYAVSLATLAAGGASRYRLSLSTIAAESSSGIRLLHAQPLAIGANASGTLETADQRDGYSVVLEAGSSYGFRMDGINLEDPQLFLLDADGEILSSNDDIQAGIQRNSYITYTARQSGIHYLAAQSFDNRYAGTYLVSAERLIDDRPDSPLTVATVAVENEVSGRLEFRGDSDWFRVQLQGDQTYQFWMDGVDLEDPYLYLRDGAGRFLASNDDIENGVRRNSRFSFAVSSNGTYFLEARSFQDAYLGAYRLGVHRISDDAGQSLTGARDLLAGSSQIGSLEWLGDSDWFRTTLQGGHLYAFELSGTGLSDPCLYLRGENGRLLSQNDDIQLGIIRDSRLRYRAESSGTYILEVRAWENRSVGGYRLGCELLESGSQPLLADLALATSFAPAAGYSAVDGYGQASAQRAAEYLVGIALPSRPKLDATLWSVDQIGAAAVWAGRGRFLGSRGRGVTVAVVDTGVDLDHPEFSGRLLEGFDFVDMDRTPDDSHGHGTHVAGILAGADDGAGAWGIAPEAWLLPVRVLDANGSGSDANVAAGIRWAADHGADVINLSLGGGDCPMILDAIRYAHAQGALVVMAAGNEGASQPTDPGRISDSIGIAVGAVNMAGTMAAFSNRSGASARTFVTAAGVDVFSSFKDSGYRIWSGTSMAAPQIAGLAALLLGIDPDLSNRDLERLISASASHGGLMARALNDNRDPITGAVIL